jgi:cytochrome b pre-mRNA-processing protein 3
MILARWRARRASKSLIEHIRGEIVAAARRPALYEALEAPDRIDGRFELLTLHAGLVLRRLIALGGLGEDIAQELVNSVFMHFDDTLRELAISDIGVSKRLKAMAGAFYGRNAAYAASLDAGSRTELTAALARNIYGGADPNAVHKAAGLADYVMAIDAALARTPIEDFATGRFRFPQGPLASSGQCHDVDRAL